MSYFVLLLILLNLTFSSQYPYEEDIKEEELLENDCEMLRFGLCIKKNSKTTAIQLVTWLQRIESENPTCQPDTSKVFRSLGKFSEAFCSNPVQMCQKVKNKVMCAQDSRFFYYDFYVRVKYVPGDTYEMGKAFSRTICTANCTEKIKLNPPSDLKSFKKWLMQVDLEKLHDMGVACWKFGGQDLTCEVQKLSRMPCTAKEIDGSYWRRVMGLNARTLADYCAPNSSFGGSIFGPETRFYGPFAKKDDRYFFLMQNYNEIDLKYELCDLKELTHVEFARSEALCLTRNIYKAPNLKQCMSNNTGPIPANESKFIEWFCKDDYEVTPHLLKSNSRTDLNEIHEICRGGQNMWMREESCRFWVVLRQIVCSPIEKWSSSIGIKEIRKARSGTWSPVDYFKCLAFGSEELVNKCYAKVGKLPPHVNALKGENLTQAICNSNKHFYSLADDVVKCLKDNGLHHFYLTNCQMHWKSQEYDVVIYLESHMNCTLPIYSKPAEECFIRVTKEKITSSAQLQKWVKKTRDSLIGQYLLNKCLNNVRKTDEQLAMPCLRSFDANNTFDELRMALCENSEEKLETGLRIINYWDLMKIANYSQLRCLMAKKDLPSVCLKVLPPLSSVDSLSKYVKWSCQIDREVNLKIKSCKEPLMQEGSPFMECYERLKHETMQQQEMDNNRIHQTARLNQSTHSPSAPVSMTNSRTTWWNRLSLLITVPLSIFICIGLHKG